MNARLSPELGVVRQVFLLCGRSYLGDDTSDDKMNDDAMNDEEMNDGKVVNAVRAGAISAKRRTEQSRERNDGSFACFEG